MVMKEEHAIEKNAYEIDMEDLIQEEDSCNNSNSCRIYKENSSWYL